MAAFVAVLLCANLIGVHKVSSVNLPFYGEFIYGAGVLFFPISYLFGDILTEVYGYARSRKVIWAGFGALIFASLMSFAVTALPAAKTMSQEHQQAVNFIFGQTPRIVLASLTAFWLGEFTNSFVLAKMKIFSAGKRLWQRTIGSTVFGEAVDSIGFLSDCFLRNLVKRAGCQRDDRKLYCQSFVGSSGNAFYIQDRQFSEKSRK